MTSSNTNDISTNSSLNEVPVGGFDAADAGKADGSPTGASGTSMGERVEVAGCKSAESSSGAVVQPDRDPRDIFCRWDIPRRRNPCERMNIKPLVTDCDPETRYYKLCEILNANLGSYLTAQRALLQIRIEGLHLSDFNDFGEFCLEYAYSESDTNLFSTQAFELSEGGYCMPDEDRIKSLPVLTIVQRELASDLWELQETLASVECAIRETEKLAEASGDRKTIKIGSFRIRSGRAVVADPGFPGSDPVGRCVLEGVKNGVWKASVLLHRDGEDEDVARLVAFASGAERALDGTPWKLVHAPIAVDGAECGIFDSASFGRASAIRGAKRISHQRSFDDEWTDVCSDITMHSKHGAGTLPCGCVSRSGFADGQYWCHVKRDDAGRICGIKVDYIHECGERLADDETQFEDFTDEEEGDDDEQRD